MEIRNVVRKRSGKFVITYSEDGKSSRVLIVSPQEIVENHKSAQQSVQSDVLPCGHDPNNLRLGNDDIYGCAECLATRR